ncbi:MAG: magnesium/cobalt transporter CorA [Candidatus Hadarchaeia archaeon]
MDYDEENLEERKPEEVDECLPFKDKPTVSWININGPLDKKTIEKIGEYFELHPLVVEDILNPEQRPKTEDFGNYILVILKLLKHEKGGIKSEQVSLTLGENFVISTQETGGEIFKSVKNRLRNDKGRIRKMGPDYLSYAMMDEIVDSYYESLENFGDELENLEEEVTSNPSPKTVEYIHKMKREIISFRKSVWPFREAINALLRGESPLIEDSSRVYLRDVYDHTIQIIDTIENYRDIVSGMLDIYLSSISNRMNEVMKVLTIIATIFIPLTFIAGVYGMNFEFMPELGWKPAYPLILLSMLGVGIAMVYYFKQKEWL